MPILTNRRRLEAENAEADGIIADLRRQLAALLYERDEAYAELWRHEAARLEEADVIDELERKRVEAVRECDLARRQRDALLGRIMDDDAELARRHRAILAIQRQRDEAVVDEAYIAAELETLQAEVAAHDCDVPADIVESIRDVERARCLEAVYQIWTVAKPRHRRHYVATGAAIVALEA